MQWGRQRAKVMEKPALLSFSTMAVLTEALSAQMYHTFFLGMTYLIQMALIWSALVLPVSCA